jgi:hypothetical protein
MLALLCPAACSPINSGKIEMPSVSAGAWAPVASAIVGITSGK